MPELSADRWRAEISSHVAAGGAGYIADLAEAVHFTSRPVEAVCAAGAPRTLRDALQGILVELLPSASSPEGGGSADSAAAADGGSGGGGAPEAARTSAAGAAGGNGSDAPSGAGSMEADSQAAAAAGARPADAGARGAAAPGAPGAQPAPALRVGGRPVDVLVGGVRAPLEAPLAWLHAALAHADHFLYVVVLPHA